MTGEYDLVKDIIRKTIGEKSVYSIEDVQRLLGKSRNEIYNLIYDGVLIPIEKNHKPRKYTFTLISVIEAYIKLSKGE